MANVTVERVLENIVYCHFESHDFDVVRDWLITKWSAKPALSMHRIAPDYPPKQRSVSTRHKLPDKYIADSSGEAIAIVDFKVGSRGTTKRKIIVQMADYRKLFDLPIILIQSIKWVRTEYLQYLPDNHLTLDQDIFILDCSMQDMIGLAVNCDGSTHAGRRHATFEETESAYVLNEPGPDEQGTCGLVWSRHHRGLCLPLHGLTRSLDPYESPFPTETGKLAQYQQALRSKSDDNIQRLNTSFGERVRAERNSQGNWEVVWPHRQLAAELEDLLD